MSNLFENNLPTMTAGEVVDSLSALYSKTIKEEKPLSSVPSIMLWGPPGVGKSQAVHQTARKIEAQTGKRVCVKDVRLLLFNPIDLRGIPTANEERTLAVWLKPEIFSMSEEKDVINVLFLDEISAAPPSVQAAAYQITLDRVIGEHKLPDNCIVIAAGNRTTDRSVAYKMPRALANRLLHILVGTDYESWRAWAVSAGINPKVMGFLAFRRSCLMENESDSQDPAFPTPRSWEMVSNLLNAFSDDLTEMHALIAGLIGSGTAVEFRTWEKVYEKLPDMEEIFSGMAPKCPDSPDGLYALIAAMTDYARKHKDDMNAITNSIVYADRLPPDYSTILMQDYMGFEEGYKEKLLKIPEFRKWLSSKGVLLNGNN